METFFELVFKDISLNLNGDTQVCCPFPHKTPDGKDYYESNPSAGINIDKGVFNCFACKTGLNEIGFIAKYMNLSYSEANQLKLILSVKENEYDWHHAHSNLLSNPEQMKITQELGLSKETVKKLRLGYEGKGGIAFPVILFGKVVDVGTYSPNLKPKTRRRAGSKVGAIMPYDIWIHNTVQPTVICAGEKDMAIATEYGMNAITITGGEKAIPTLFKNDFKDRTIFIIYDNDDVGRTGSKQLAVFLKPLAKQIKVIDLSATCTEKGEDLWDYLIKYNKTKQDLTQLIINTPEFNEEDYQEEKEKIYPTLSLIEAGKPLYSGKVVRTNIQVQSVVETQFQLPSALRAEKTKVDEDSTPSKNRMIVGQERSWYLNERNIGDVLYLIDSKLKASQIYTHKLEILGISKNEEHIKLTTDAKETVYKCSLSDVLNPEDLNGQRTEIMAYSINTKLDNGKKYRVTHKLVPHPFDGQKLIMIIMDVEAVDDSITNFKIDAQKIEHLKMHQVVTTLEDKINENVERIRGMMGAEYNAKLVLLIDFVYHSVLHFNLGRWKNIRGALDVLVVGESRTGKSSTNVEFMERYGVGRNVSLPTTTKTALTGGSNIVQGSYQTRAGIIPMEHGGLIALEELGKARDGNILEEITEIKSSGVTRISRVSGTIELPSVVRFIAITNSKTHGTHPKPISSYPNGIAVVTDLVGKAEDIARIDLIGVFSFMANKDLDPFQVFKEPFENEVYRTKIRWIWSRKPHQIVFNKAEYLYLIKESNRMKNEFDSYIKIFGTETWKKLSRLSIAIAGYVASTDDTYENIVVKIEHIKYAAAYMESLYDNHTFRLREFVAEEKRYREIDDAGVVLLQNLFMQNPTLLLHLESVAESSRNNMSAIAGMENSQFSKYVNSMVAGLFITFHGHSIHPTERFRKGMKKIKRKTSVNKIGEILYDKPSVV